MNVFIVVSIVIINFILQTTVFQYIDIFGVKPNTSLILVVVFALLNNKRFGGILGLLVGFLQDVIFSKVIGIYALIYFLVGYIVGLFNKVIFKANPVTPFIFTLLSTLVSYIVYHIFMYFFAMDIEFLDIIKSKALIEMIYNSLLSIFIYKKIAKYYEEPYSRYGLQSRR
ncbi:MAG: rod shape-determining protein MreD [Firmicutes bacterium]|nr:rod shape-determining protein MreD [Bacillota bacterium]